MNVKSIEERFAEFNAANPGLYDDLVSMARNLQSAGTARYGMKGLFEVLRWQQAVSTTGDKYKLNNDYTAMYARLIMEREPDLAGFFETRARDELENGWVPATPPTPIIDPAQGELF